MHKEIVTALRSKVEDDKLDIYTISRTIRSVFKLVSYPDIEYSDDFPKSLKKSRTLKGHDAEEFIEEADKYISKLRRRVSGDIKKYRTSLTEALKKENIGESIFKKYSEVIDQLESDIKNKELSLARWNDILKQLDNINE